MAGKLDYSKLSDEELQHIANDDYSKLSDETLRKLAADEAATKNIEATVDQDQIGGNRIAGAALGAGAGLKVAPFVAGKYALTAGIDEIAKRFPRQTPSVTVEAAPASYNTPHGVGAGAVSNAEHNVGQILKNKVAQAALETPGYVSPGNSTILMPEGVAKAEEAAQAAKATEAAKNASALAKTKDLAAKYGKYITPGGIPGKVLNTVLPVASLAGAGAQAADALTRFQHGDVGRGIVSGVGALGSAASAIPHPATRLIGTGLSLAAPAINYGIDTALGRNYAEGGDVDVATMHKEIIAHRLAPKKNKPKYTIDTLPPGLTKEQFEHLCKGGHVEMPQHFAKGGDAKKPRPA
jgi:hypothetical protein